MDLITLIASVILLETSYLVFRQNKQTVPVAAKHQQRILLDTSVLIDGRIESIVRSGFVSAELIVPSSVVRELQYMADKADHEKRERARFGLDRIQLLQSLDACTVTIYDDGPTHEAGVDEQLIVLARKLNASLCTIDYNLNKVAKVESLHVININELAHALRPAHLPGERIKVEIVQKGQVKEQGVGYLDDGTMIVVDNAKKYIGSTVDAEAVRMLQTEAGRMLFAKLVTVESKTAQAPKQTSPKTPNRRQRRSPEDALIESARQQR
jgi:uncharacterized protein YacL